MTQFIATCEEHFIQPETVAGEGISASCDMNVVYDGVRTAAQITHSLTPARSRAVGREEGAAADGSSATVGAATMRWCNGQSQSPHASQARAL